MRRPAASGRARAVGRDGARRTAGGAVAIGAAAIGAAAIGAAAIGAATVGATAGCGAGPVATREADARAPRAPSAARRERQADARGWTGMTAAGLRASVGLRATPGVAHVALAVPGGWRDAEPAQVAWVAAELGRVRAEAWREGAAPDEAARAGPARDGRTPAGGPIEPLVGPDATTWSRDCDAAALARCVAELAAALTPATAPASEVRAAVSRLGAVRRRTRGDERRRAEALALAGALDARIAWGAFGRPTDDAAVRSEDVGRFVETYHRAERAWWVVVGDATAPRVHAALEAASGVLARGPAAGARRAQPGQAPAGEVASAGDDGGASAVPAADEVSVEVGEADWVAVALRVRASHEEARRLAAEAEARLGAWSDVPHRAAGVAGVAGAGAAPGPHEARVRGFALRDGAALVASARAVGEPHGAPAASARGAERGLDAHARTTERLAWALATTAAEGAASADARADAQADATLARAAAERAHALLGTAAGGGHASGEEGGRAAVAWIVAGGRGDTRGLDPDAALRDRAIGAARSAWRRARVIAADAGRGQARPDAASLAAVSGGRVEVRARAPSAPLAVAVLFAGGAAEDPATAHGRAAVAAFSLREACVGRGASLTPVVEADAFGVVVTGIGAAPTPAQLDAPLGCVLTRRPTDADVVGARLALDALAAWGTPDAEAAEAAALAARTLAPARPGSVAPSGARETIGAVTGDDVRRLLDAARVGARLTLAAVGDVDAGALGRTLARRAALVRPGAVAVAAPSGGPPDAPRRDAGREAGTGDGAPVAATRDGVGVRAVVVWTTPDPGATGALASASPSAGGTRSPAPSHASAGRPGGGGASATVARGAARAAAEALGRAAGLRVVAYGGGVLGAESSAPDTPASAYAYVALAADDDAVDALPATVRARVAALSPEDLAAAVRAQARAEAAERASAPAQATALGLARLRGAAADDLGGGAEEARGGFPTSLLASPPRIVVARPARGRPASVTGGGAGGGAR